MGVRVEDGEASHAANVALVTAEWLSTLGVRPVLGRGFLAEEFLPGRDNVGVLTHVYWQRRFGGDPAVIGRLLRIDGRPVTIVGVLPPNVLRYGADLLLPLVIGTYPPSREYRNLDVVARLRPEATIASAQAALDVLARQLDAGLLIAEREPRILGRAARQELRLDRSRRGAEPDAAARCCRAGAPDGVRECRQPTARTRRSRASGNARSAPRSARAAGV